MSKQWRKPVSTTSKRSTGRFPTQKTLPKLTKELDAIFSIFIRLRDTKEGLCQCFTCPVKLPWKEMDNGHYWSRRFTSVRWHEKNCHAQCTGCNIFHEGNKPAYTRKLVELYGPGILEELEIKKNNRSTIGRFEIGYLIQEYQQKVEELRSQKGL